MTRRHLPRSVLSGSVLLEAVPGATRHLRDCPECAAELDSSAACMAELVSIAELVAPPPALFERALASIAAFPRLEHLSRDIARLLDVSHETAREYLKQIDEPVRWQSTPFSGVTRLPIEGGPRTAGAVTHFVRVKAGKIIPSHEHLGPEIGFILQGRALCDDGHVCEPRDENVMPLGSQHSFRGLPVVDCIMLEIASGGLRFGDVELLPSPLSPA
jgi:anti-sigma factor ChrR (cupin superfamily)